MKERCLNPNTDHWNNYGARGITVYPEWIESFEAFLSHVGLRPSKAHTLDRIDGNGNYVPGNVRWATLSEQATNRRSTRWVIFNGERMSLSAFAQRAGLKIGTAWSRIVQGGCTPEQAAAMGTERKQKINGGFARKYPYPMQAEETGCQGHERTAP